MKQKYPKMILKAGRERSLLRGHPWLFSGAVASFPANAEPGQIVCAVASDQQSIALGFFNPSSDIVFRALTSEPDAVIDGEFWLSRFRLSAALRARVLPPETTACRLVNAEGDGMPGLIVDRYGDQLVMSIHTAGIERHRAEILRAMDEAYSPSGIYERSEGGARKAEGLRESVGAVSGAENPAVVEILENGLRFQVDIVSGQKTGFFLDQRDSRTLIRSLSRGAQVLNCFFLHGGLLRVCRLRRGAAGRLRRGVGCGQRGRRDASVPQRTIGGEPSRNPGRRLPVSAENGRPLRPDHPRSARVCQGEARYPDGFARIQGH